MRVVLIVPKFPQLSETFIVQKFLGLLECGWDVHILCSHSPAEQWKNFPQIMKQYKMRRRVRTTWQTQSRAKAAVLFPLALLHNLIFAPIATLRYLWQGWHRFGIDIFRRFYLDAKLITLQPNLIHFEFGSLAVDRMYLIELLNANMIVSFRGHDLNFVGLEAPGYYEQVWNKADAIHLLGNDLWQQAQRRGCPPTMHHILIAPSVAVEHFKPGEHKDMQIVGTTQRPLRILSVGRLVWSKGYDYSLHAVKFLVERGIVCEFRIVGGGNLLEAIAFARHQLNLEETVKLLGPQSPDEVKKQMEWADVFLHAAVEEGFCNAVIEAQAMMLPVVSSDAGGLPENVQDGLTGFVVPRRDPKALADKLALLAKDSKLRSRMGEAGRMRVQSFFTLSKQIRQFDEFYRQVLGEAASRRI